MSRSEGREVSGPFVEGSNGPETPGFLLWRVTLGWQRAMRVSLAPFGLTHVQYVLLSSLRRLETGGPPSQQRLAEHAGTDPMMTSQVVRRLVARGVVSRAVDPSDARVHLLSLSPDGVALVGAAGEAVSSADRAYFAALGSSCDDFVRGLTRLL
ncbi:MarR family winged helix-turn-helix transcriptional regulator [Lentzea sp. NPDC058450]|uniref:MarR family winged helix-turn-helix transcriptional regulator n=1 Tax=Lentzea sp. NPDC058450 TaxID=3346505 RepID=UPI00366399B0